MPPDGAAADAANARAANAARAARAPQDVPCLLPRRLPALLAAMAYAKAETLWYFR